MRYNRILVWSLLLILIVGCGSKSTKENQPETEQVAQEEAEGKIVKGVLIIGHEVSSFRACNDSLDYWVVDETAQLDSLYYKEVEYDLEPYVPVYVELKVTDRDQGAGEYAKEYEGVYEVQEIRDLRKWDEAGDCQ